MGPDGISVSFLKEVVSILTYPLIIIIYNKSLETSAIPSLWRKSNVTPIHKCGSLDDPSNPQFPDNTAFICSGRDGHDIHRQIPDVCQIGLHQLR